MKLTTEEYRTIVRDTRERASMKLIAEIQAHIDRFGTYPATLGYIWQRNANAIWNEWETA